jgi:hypothetical protein
MKQICGYVLVKETNSGVPNLVVTAYDCEKSIEAMIADRREKNGASLEKLGKRIGSVLTDQDGKFTLESNELEFQGNESRPDLLILILAPEDIQDPESPFPLLPEQRVLYVSTVPRTDAGAEEAFFIRLLQKQLDRFHISSATSARESVSSVGRLGNAIENTWDFRDSLRNRLKGRLQQEQDKSEKIRKHAQDKVKNLSAIPLHLRDSKMRNNRLLIIGKKQLAEKLVAAQDQSITDGVKHFKERVMHLTLTSDDLKDLGLEEKDGALIGEVSGKVLIAKVRVLTNGVDLVRRRGFDNPSPEVLEHKYLVDGAAAPVEITPDNH